MSSLLIFYLVTLSSAYVSSLRGPIGPPFDDGMGSLNRIGAPVGEAPLYLVKFTMNCDQKGTRDIVGTAASINYILCSNTKHSGTQCIYKYKVTGEPRIIVVMKVLDVIQLEKQLAEINRIGCVDVTTEPMSSYENIWLNLGQDPSFVQPTANNVEGINELTWCTYRFGYTGLSSKQFKKLMVMEGRSVFTYRHNGIPLNLFKIQGQLRNEVFVKMSVPDFEVEFMKTPMFVQNGHNVNLQCCGMLELNYYLQRMSKKY